MQDENQTAAVEAAKTKGGEVPRAAAGRAVNAKSSIWRRRAGFRLDRRRKPECVAIRVGGRLRLVGVCQAAEWLGVSRTTFFNIVADKKHTGTAAETVALVKREYPGLFKGEEVA
ncbi:MAG: hypothetical protein J6V72_02025 [Kiritimatiellae bacterium]|nr:hypothetical protein [Kiritimatiellia bacterium]